MVDYKVGDTVRRTGARYGGMSPGDTARALMAEGEVALTKYGRDHDPSSLIKCDPVFDPDEAAKLKAEAMQAVAKYNEYLKLYIPPFKPLVLE